MIDSLLSYIYHYLLWTYCSAFENHLLVEIDNNNIIITNQ